MLDSRLIEAHLFDILLREKPKAGVRRPRKCNLGKPVIETLSLGSKRVHISEGMHSFNPLSLGELERRFIEFAQYADSRTNTKNDPEILRYLFNFSHLTTDIWLAGGDEVRDCAALRNSRSSNFVRAVSVSNYSELFTLKTLQDTWLVEQDGVVFGIDECKLVFDGKVLTTLPKSGARLRLPDAVTLVKYEQDPVWSWALQAYPLIRERYSGVVSLLAVKEAYCQTHKFWLYDKPPTQDLKYYMEEYYR